MSGCQHQFVPMQCDCPEEQKQIARDERALVWTDGVMWKDGDVYVRPAKRGGAFYAEAGIAVDAIEDTADEALATLEDALSSALISVRRIRETMCSATPAARHKR